jgi:hypothetical protein
MFSLTYSDKNTKVSIQYDTIDDLKKFYDNFGKMFGPSTDQPEPETQTETVQEPEPEPDVGEVDDITLSDTTSTASSESHELEDSKDSVQFQSSLRLTSQIPELEQSMEQPQIVEFPEIRTKDEFIGMLNDVGISTKSHKNYMKYWQYPIFTEIYKRDIESVVKLLSGLIQDIGDNSNDIQRAYNLFSLIFKINNHYKVFSDLNQVNKLFDPLKTLKSKVCQKKTQSKQQK